ncbi:MAG: SpoIVB peptidase [Clostridiales bacterium]|jgi:stage IV sporulation protein B|nr:SpoIVB peptidase [Clostridiales bacterium]
MKTRLNKVIAGVVVLCTLLLIAAFTQLPLQFVDDLPNSAIISWEDIDNIHQINLTCEYDMLQSTSIDGCAYGNINIKAFGFLPIRRVKVKVEPNRKVFLGGQPLGLMLNSDGVIVVDTGNIKTSQGVVGSKELRKGDIIKKINNISVLYPQDIAEFFDKHDGSAVDLQVQREGKSIVVKTIPFYDDVNKEYKLGAWVKDKIAGLGTLSYVRLDGRFGALGHPVIDNDTGLVFPVYDGKVYQAKIVSVDKGNPGKAGELKGAFNSQDKNIGDIYSNNKYGIFGKLKSNLPDKIMPVGSRLTARVGKAKIVSTVDNNVQEYDVEIVKINSQKKKTDKSMVLKITDKNLLDITGGIVQGMSGSPIVQDGKVIGAVTHVFVNDPTRGYGIYLDWMYDN